MKLKCLPISRLVGYRGLEPHSVGLQPTALPVKLTTHRLSVRGDAQLANKTRALVFSTFKLTEMVPQKGLEPLTPRLEGACSFQLSYWGKQWGQATPAFFATLVSTL